ncbi:MAG: hypothetical protein AB7W16_11365 [Candidatus Obscuribacterales bacterium]
MSRKRKTLARKQRKLQELEQVKVTDGEQLKKTQGGMTANALSNLMKAPEHKA